MVLLHRGAFKPQSAAIDCVGDSICSWYSMSGGFPWLLGDCGRSVLKESITTILTTARYNGWIRSTRQGILDLTDLGDYLLLLGSTNTNWNLSSFHPMRGTLASQAPNLCAYLYFSYGNAVFSKLLDDKKYRVAVMAFNRSLGIFRGKRNSRRERSTTGIRTKEADVMIEALNGTTIAFGNSVPSLWTGSRLSRVSKSVC